MNLEATNTPFSVLTLDIDHFKAVNDSQGHDQGDHVLKKLASHMKATFVNMMCAAVSVEKNLLSLWCTKIRKIAYIAAERLRKTVAQSYIDPNWNDHGFNWYRLLASRLREYSRCD